MFLAYGRASLVAFLANYTTAESFDQSMRVTLGVATLERVLASSEFSVIGRPVDFHSWPFALAMISRA